VMTVNRLVVTMSGPLPVSTLIWIFMVLLARLESGYL
jgi:hypothetical protein